jgi:ABC-type multidrug transport system permease subunit
MQDENTVPFFKLQRENVRGALAKRKKSLLCFDQFLTASFAAATLFFFFFFFCSITFNVGVRSFVRSFLLAVPMVCYGMLWSGMVWYGRLRMLLLFVLSHNGRQF